MGLRFFKRVRLVPGLTLNVSKRGASVSVGEKGAHITVGTSGVTETVGLPGTGASSATGPCGWRRSDTSR